MIGTIHAWLITCVGLPPFIATLASLVGLRSLAKVLTQQITAQLGARVQRINVSDRDFAVETLAALALVEAV